jgi:hypothetical protein
MSFTVVPLHRLDLGKGARIPFGRHFVLQDVPLWLTQEKANKSIIADLSCHDRELALNSPHALITEYEADCLGYPDPEWQGVKPRGIQSLRMEAAVLANFCIWLIKPSGVSFTNAFHALTKLNGRTMNPPVVIQAQGQATLYCHPKDVHRNATARDIVKAGVLYDALSTVRRNNSLWEAMRAAWDGLVTYDADRRYPPFWLGIEALFGRDSVGNQLTRTLARRVAFFLASDHKEAQHLHDMVIRCYQMRCKIVHGRWDNDPDLEGVMYETEAIVRTTFRVIADDPKLLSKFASPQRDRFLSELVHKRGKKMPPLVEPPGMGGP